MQPYFFPYIGYFQLMNAVDNFVVYDNIEFSRKGWINRNRLLVNGADAYFTLPLRKDSDFLHVKDRYLAETWPNDRKKLLNRFAESYRKARNFKEVYPLIEGCLMHEEQNLFRFLLNSLMQTRAYLGIKTPFTISSEIPIDHELKSSQKVLTICKAVKAETYMNPIGGVGLYDKQSFRDQGVELKFLMASNVTYSQFDHPHVPNLSIIDVMMFNIKESLQSLLLAYTLE